jgi:hypothetical protein
MTSLKNTNRCSGVIPGAAGAGNLPNAGSTAAGAPSTAAPAGSLDKNTAAPRGGEVGAGSSSSRTLGPAPAAPVVVTKRARIDALLLEGKTPIQVHHITGLNYGYIKDRSRRLGLKQSKSRPSEKRLEWTPEMLAALDPLIHGTDTAPRVAKRIGVELRTLIYGLAARARAAEARA